MKRTLLTTALALMTCLGMAEIESREITYTAGGQQLKGVLVQDTAVSAVKPGVLVVPEYWGVNDYAKRRARMLAELGYVAFVADMYGDGKSTTDSKQAGAWSGEVKGNRPLMRERALSGLEQLKAQPGVDKDRLAAVGYCFGGTTVLEIARANGPVKGVVSFHGGLEPGNAPVAPQIEPKVLVLHGAVDPHVSPESLVAFEKEMATAKADWYLVSYGSAVHAFTNPKAGSDPAKGVAYNEPADKRSWEAMKDFLAEIFSKTKVIAGEQSSKQ